MRLDKAQLIDADGNTLCAGVDMEELGFIYRDVPDLKLEGTKSKLFPEASACAVTSSSYMNAVIAATVVDAGNEANDHLENYGAITDELLAVRAACGVVAEVAFDPNFLELYNCHTSKSAQFSGYMAYLTPLEGFTVVRVAVSDAGEHADRYLNDGQALKAVLAMTRAYSG